MVCAAKKRCRDGRSVIKCISGCGTDECDLAAKAAQTAKNFVGNCFLCGGDAATRRSDGVPWAKTDGKAHVTVSDYGTGIGRTGSVPTRGGTGHRGYDSVRSDVGGSAAARMAHDGQPCARNGLEQKKCGAGGGCCTGRRMGLLF